jgi:hypothetical protein
MIQNGFLEEKEKNKKNKNGNLTFSTFGLKACSPSLAASHALPPFVSPLPAARHLPA